jgi:hypothetical protein
VPRRASFAAAGLDIRTPQAAFYLYPGFRAWRGALATRLGVTTDQALARHLLDRYGMGVLPASAFGEDTHALRLRVATGLLKGTPTSGGNWRWPLPTRSPSAGSRLPWTESERSWPISPPVTTLRSRYSQPSDGGLSAS